MHVAARRVVVAVAGLLAGAAAWSSPARACSCAPGGLGLYAPPDGAVDVPRDARLWLSAPSSSPAPVVLLRVRGGDVIDVDAASFRAGGDVVRVLAPRAPLPAGAVVDVEIDGTATSFTVGDRDSDGAPAPPAARIVRVRSDAELDEAACGPWHGASYDLRSDAMLVVVDLQDGAAFDASGPTGAITTATRDGSLFLGRNVCADTWPAAAPLATADVRFGAFSVGGAFSGWTEPTPIALPPSGTSCAAARVGAATTPWGALSACAAVVLAARRRPRGCAPSAA